MRTDGLFRTHHVELKSWPMNQALTLIPWGDVHYDSPAHSEDTFDEFCERGKDARDTLFLGMGDYTDSFSTSERRIVYHRDLHESTLKREEGAQKARIHQLARKLDWMRGKCIGLLGGNHYMEFQDGTTGDQLLAQLLGCKYLGVCAAIRISFRGKGRQTTSCVDIFAHHGRGAGQTAGGRMNSVEKLAGVADADIYLMGDNHARGALPIGDKLRLHTNANGVSLRSRTSWIARTGSFLRGYVDGESTYVVDGAMKPASLGWVEFYLTPKRHTDKDHDITTVKIEGKQ